MAEPRSFRFGTNIQAASRGELFEQVRKIEDLGYSTLTITDHVSMPRLAPIATLAAVAALDSSLRLTTTVLGNDFRHPVFLASEAAAVDVISDGRLELGIGTGWLKADYERSGIHFDLPGIRVSRLIEAIHILKGLFSDQPLTFEGQHYTIRDLNLRPKPVQRPHPPLLIGGGGKRMLSLAAREANIVGVNPTTKDGTMDISTFTAEAFAQKVDWVREAAGTRFAELELHCLLYGVVVSDDPREGAEQWIKWTESIFGAPLAIGTEEVLASPYILTGTIDQMVNKLQGCREQYGVSYFTTVSFIPPETLSPVVTRLTGT